MKVQKRNNSKFPQIITIPLGPQKSGIPKEVDIPEPPVNTTRCFMLSLQAEKEYNNKRGRLRCKMINLS